MISIQENLQWLGLNWDGIPIFQSHRRGLYSSFLSWMRRTGDIYPCRCSRSNLVGLSVYPGTCRKALNNWGWFENRLSSWRLRIPIVDVHGSGDFVLRRADGYISYNLATVIDELCFGISDVIRGEDLRESEPSQLSLFDAFSEVPPKFQYVPLLFDSFGRKLSKCNSSSGLSKLREEGKDASDVIGILAAGLGLLPKYSRLSATELLSEMAYREINSMNS